MSTQRYRLYREHKFVSFMLSDFSRAVAKANFSVDAQVAEVQEKLAGIKGLMDGHAEHEDKAIHALLREKGSTVYEQIEEDHNGHEATFEQLNSLLSDILASADPDERVTMGHQFYLMFQQFEGHNLLHQFQEETVLMPELQRLYTDEELLQKIEAKTYEEMTPEQMSHMMGVLFEHFNPSDRAAFLTDIHTAQPGKFLEAWQRIAPKIEESERRTLMEQFSIQVTAGSDAALEDGEQLYYAWEPVPEGGGRPVKTQYDVQREEEAAKAAGQTSTAVAGSAVETAAPAARVSRENIWHGDGDEDEEDQRVDHAAHLK